MRQNAVGILRAHQLNPRWEPNSNAPDVRLALDEARRLRDAGQPEQAEAIWNAIEALYRNEPGGEAVRDLIRAERNKKS